MPVPWMVWDIRTLIPRPFCWHSLGVATLTHQDATFVACGSKGRGGGWENMTQKRKETTFFGLFNVLFLKINGSYKMIRYDKYILII